jgi:competence protein ComEA
MKKKVQSTCLECHDASRILKQRRDRKWWAQNLTKMIGLGAQVEDDERDALLEYLSKNFGEGKAAPKSPSVGKANLKSTKAKPRD